MASFAKISEENEVIQVLALDDVDCQNESNVETESVGQAYLELHNTCPAHLWIQTSYNTRANKYWNNDGTEHSDHSRAFRGIYACIGFTWDSANEIFWPPQPYASWTKNTTTAEWDSPVSQPLLTSEQQSQNDAKTHKWWYDWNEENQTWDLTDVLA